MYLSNFGLLRGLLSIWSTQQTPDIRDSPFDDHSYFLGNVANRGPCPGLNALANHGYLYVAVTLSSLSLNSL